VSENSYKHPQRDYQFHFYFIFYFVVLCLYSPLLKKNRLRRRGHHVVTVALDSRCTF